MMINWARHDMCKTELHAGQGSGHVSGSINNVLAFIGRKYMSLRVREYWMCVFLWVRPRLWLGDCISYCIDINYIRNAVKLSLLLLRSTVPATHDMIITWSTSVMTFSKENRNVLLTRFSKNCEKRLLASSCPFVRLSAWNKSAFTGRILIKFDIWVFFENLSRKFKFN